MKANTYAIGLLLFIYINYTCSSPNWEYIKTEHIFLFQNPSSNILNEHPRCTLFFKGTPRTSGNVCSPIILQLAITDSKNPIEEMKYLLTYMLTPYKKYGIKISKGSVQ